MAPSTAAATSGSSPATPTQPEFRAPRSRRQRPPRLHQPPPNLPHHRIPNRLALNPHDRQHAPTAVGQQHLIRPQHIIDRQHPPLHLDPFTVGPVHHPPAHNPRQHRARHDRPLGRS